MKRLILLFIFPLFISCSNKEKAHIKTFKKFCNSVYVIDLKAVSALSTESTNRLINACVEHGVNPLCAISGTDIVTVTSKIQYDIKIVRDSLSDDNSAAWIWFKINDIDKLYIVEMLKIRGEWRVDLPLT